MSEQNLNVISLAPIRDSLGDRWSVKYDQVWSQVEHFLRHQFDPDDLILRLDEISVLVVQPKRSRVSAQTLAIRAASDLSRFFLGDAAFGDIVVRNVDAIEADEVVCSPLPRRQVAAALMANDPSLWTSAAAHRMPILTPLGRELSVEVSLAPILSLQAGKRGLGQVVNTLVKDVQTGEIITADVRGRLQSSDIAGVDLAVLGSIFKQRRESEDALTPIVLPISIHSLGHSSARYAMLQKAHELTQAEKQNLVLEIVDLEPGAPQSRIAEVVSMVRPHCRGVICRTDLSLESARKVRDAGATLSSEPLRHVSEAALLKLEAAMAQILKIMPAVMIHGLAPELLPVAAFIGVTHCTVAIAG